MMLSTPYYRRFGIRRLDQLISPVKAPLDSLQLPRMAIYHYIPDSATDLGPSANELIFRNVRKPIGLQFKTEPESFLGNPRRLATSVTGIEKQFFTKNRKRYRRMKVLEQYDGDMMSQVAYSYSLIARRQFYLTTKMSPYYQWYNIQKTAMNNIAATLEKSVRQHYIPVSVPTNVPSPGTLNRFSTELTIEGLKYFDTPEKFMLLELWRFITDGRQYGIFNEIPRKHLHKVNLLFVDRNSWFVMNLGRIDAWRKAPESEISLDPEANKKGAAPSMLGKMFLRGMMDIIASRSLSVDELKTEHDKYLVEEGEPVEDQDGDAPVSGGASGVSSGAAAIQARTDDSAEQDEPDTLEADKDARALQAFKHRESRRLGVYDEDETIEEDYTKNDTAATLAQRVSELTRDLPEGLAGDASSELPALDLAELESALDEDFEILDTIEAKVLARKESEEVSSDDLPPLTPEPTLTLEPDKAFMRLADDLAEQGQIAGSAYRRFERLSEKYKDITLPDGQTLVQAATIKPEQLKLKRPTPAFTMPGVPDQSYIGSTLDEFDKVYIEQVMDKDFASMILALPKGGLAVTDVKVKEEEDISGKRKTFSVRVAPLEGEPSTLTFSYPVPDKFGRFKSGGVMFRYRRQQAVPMPIKKISDREVALTTYYGKSFVRKPTFKIHDYAAWLFRQISLKELNKENIAQIDEQSDIKETVSVPMVFKYIGAKIASFHLQALGLPFVMDFTTNAERREALFGKGVIASLESEGSRLIGKAGKDDYLIMDSTNRITHVDSGGARIDVGFIEDLLSLPSDKAPVEFTELTVMGDTIPVGVVLGYYHGFNWLLRRFKPTFRRVPMGTRISATPEEFVVRFSDQALVFNKRDPLSTLIFAGWNKYRNVIRNYSLVEFNTPDVYMNVLEDSGVSYRRLSELTRMLNMFIDPISLDLLKEMGEPTVFDELLIRATELLTKGEIPLVLDRNRGYERFPGAFYNEVVRSLARHDNRYGKAKAKIDFNPHAVEMSILTDPAKMMVNEINPIDDLKQMEAVSFSGTGGRNSRSVTREDRIFKMEQRGTISEATVDNDKVGSNAYMPAKPLINSVRGTVDLFDPESDSTASLVSTSMLVSPSSDKDDPKRVN